MNFLFLIPLALLIGFVLFIYLTNRRLSARGHRGPVSDHFNGTIFQNYGEGRGLPRAGFGAFLKWMIQRRRAKWAWRDNPRLATAVPPAERVLGSELVVTFVNHATVLLQTHGLNIITDPVWSKRVSPFSWLGPARFQPPGLRFEDLPPIDAVLISHNHYDHMDLATLRRIADRWQPKIYVGLGNKEYLNARGLENVYEMDWWDGLLLAEGIRIVCAPGQHFSARALSDRNNTLWCGYVVETPDGAMYFAGDTGYGPFVSKINERYAGGFRLALLPIGAFKPEWFMGPVHTSPDQAFQMHRELKARISVGIHFGTFHLADDGQDEPAERVRELLNKEASVPENKVVPDFRVLENGQSIRL